MDLAQFLSVCMERLPELQKLLTFQHENEQFGAMIAHDDLGRDQWLTIADNKDTYTRDRKPIGY
jgi:hypothetical protein